MRWEQLRAGFRACKELTGTFVPQPPSEWTGPFPLPAPIAELYRELGPRDVALETGNAEAFELPALARLWGLQEPYRVRSTYRWPDDWLVVARTTGGDPVVVSREDGTVLFVLETGGPWQAAIVAPDLPTFLQVLLGITTAFEAFDGDAADEDDSPDWLSHITRVTGDAEVATSALAGLGYISGDLTVVTPEPTPDWMPPLRPGEPTMMYDGLVGHLELSLDQIVAAVRNDPHSPHFVEVPGRGWVDPRTLPAFAGRF